MVNRIMPRVQDVVLPLLRERMPDTRFITWIPDVDYREYPLVLINRKGGSVKNVRLWDEPIIEVTAMTRDGLIPTENLLLDVRTALWGSVQDQDVVPGVGYLHSYFETMPPRLFDARFDDTWRIQLMVKLGLRPARK